MYQRLDEARNNFYVTSNQSASLRENRASATNSSTVCNNRPQNSNKNNEHVKAPTISKTTDKNNLIITQINSDYIISNLPPGLDVIFCQESPLLPLGPPRVDEIYFEDMKPLVPRK